MNKKLIILMYCALSFYCLGGGFMEHFTVFHSWTLLAESDFVNVHHVSGMRTMYVYVTPLIIHFLFTAVLLWKKTISTSSKWLWVILSCHIITWVSTFVIQLPIQLALYNGKDMQMLTKLINTDWIRFVALLTLVYATINILKENLTLKKATENE